LKEKTDCSSFYMKREKDAYPSLKMKIKIILIKASLVESGSFAVIQNNKKAVNQSAYQTTN